MFSVGYEGRSLDDFLHTLAFNGVQILVDVRENAVSRKPGFGKRSLAEALEAAGIGYRHEPLLGNPRDNRDAFRSGKTGVAKRRYLRYLNNGSRAAFDAVLELAMTKRIALLCFEHDEAQCHRSCNV